MIALEECLIFLLAKAYQHVNSVARTRLESFGVTPTQYALLHVLWEHGPQSGAALGARLRLDSASITGLIDRLAHLGLVERSPDPTDRRESLVALTIRGAELQAPLQEAIAAFNAELDAILGAAESARLRALLRGLISAYPLPTR
ncbi:MAG: MarR family transcriptional regulator [Oscillochloridaceae bacterium]|nr:MarR family transcriptional regulator [Chloroflexaceae bacterium]MDW8390403.1 MarR family transcriptional regulator [Oscillochloridaceae bacterium]